MDILAAAAKSAIAVVLVVAGGAKLADLASFAATIRLFLPRRTPALFARSLAYGTALGELGLGVGSLCFPALTWLSLLVLAVCCAFVAVSVSGYVLYRGRSCRCFGALSPGAFDAVGILRTALMAGLAAAAMSGIPPVALRVAPPARILLIVSTAMLAFAAFTAARALAVTREP
jgi:hypothetical protein